MKTIKKLEIKELIIEVSHHLERYKSCSHKYKQRNKELALAFSPIVIFLNKLDKEKSEQLKDKFKTIINNQLTHKKIKEILKILYNEFAINFKTINK